MIVRKLYLILISLCLFASVANAQSDANFAVGSWQATRALNSVGKREPQILVISKDEIVYDRIHKAYVEFENKKGRVLIKRIGSTHIIFTCTLQDENTMLVESPIFGRETFVRIEP